MAVLLNIATAVFCVARSSLSHCKSKSLTLKTAISDRLGAQPYIKANKAASRILLVMIGYGGNTSPVNTMAIVCNLSIKKPCSGNPGTAIHTNSTIAVFPAVNQSR